MKKITSLLLVLSMCLGLFVPAAFAEEKKIYKIVAVGDSTANGLGQSDYGFHSRYETVRASEAVYVLDPMVVSTLNLGFLDTGSKQAYPYRLSQYIQEQHPEYDVQFTNLGISGMRNTEMAAIIDSDYKGDSFTAYDLYCINEEFNAAYGTGDLHELFVREIMSADLITVDGVMNSFTSYLVGRINKLLSSEEDKQAYHGLFDDDFSDLPGSVTSELKTLVEPLKEEFLNTFGSIIPQNIITDFADTILYVCYSCMLNFTKLVQSIRDINPTARIIVGGAYNPLGEISFSYGDIKLNMKNLMNTWVDLLDTYITNFDPNRFCFSYIEVPDDVEIFADYFADLDSAWDMDPRLADELIDEFYDEIVHDGGIREFFAIAAEKARTQGIDEATIQQYAILWTPQVLEIMNAYRENNGNIDPMDAIIAELFADLLNLVIKATKHRVLDLEYFFDNPYATQYDGVYKYSVPYVMSRMLQSPTEELPEAAVAMITQYVMAEMREGIGAHPSPNGVAQKYEAALKVYNSELKAASKGAEIRSDFCCHGLMSIFSVITAIIPAIRSLLRGVFSK